MRMPEPSVQPAKVKDHDNIQLKEEEQDEIQPKLMGPQISSIQCKEEDQELVQTRLMSSVQRREIETGSLADLEGSGSDADYSLNRKPLSFGSQSLIQRSGRDPPSDTNT